MNLFWQKKWNERKQRAELIFFLDLVYLGVLAGFDFSFAWKQAYSLFLEKQDPFSGQKQKLHSSLLKKNFSYFHKRTSQID